MSVVTYCTSRAIRYIFSVLQNTNLDNTYVRPPRPMAVKKLTAKRVFRGLSRGNRPSKYICNVLEIHRDLMSQELLDIQYLYIDRSKLTDLLVFHSISIVPCIQLALGIKSWWICDYKRTNMLNAGTDLPWGSRGVPTLPSGVYPPPREVQHHPKKSAWPYISAFWVAISGTSTVSMCRFLETI